MSRLRDLSGQSFGQLTVIERDLTIYPGKKKTTRWWCKCKCGKVFSANSDDIVRGHTNSCGCYHKQKASEFLTKERSKSNNYHLSKTKAYRTWRAMMSRCYKSNFTFYSYYGGRGIKVCERWHTYTNFLEDMGQPESNMTIDRIDPNGDYCPENCKWTTMQRQNNNRRSCIFVLIDNKKLSVADFCREFNLDYPQTLSLIHNGKTPIEILKMNGKY